MVKWPALIAAIVVIPSLAWTGNDRMVVKKSSHSVAATLDRLSEVLKTRGIGITTRVDHAAAAENVGQTLKPTQLLIFGNPKLGTPLMQSNRRIGVELPMRVLAWEDDRGQLCGSPERWREIAMASFVGNFPRLIALTAVFGLLVDACLGTLSADPISWRLEWPRTDFSKHSVPFAGIKSGGPPKDGIPAIDAPRFERLADGKATGSSAALGDTEPVIAVSIGEDARAYPLRVLIWHEIANDAVGGTPVVVTYCPLCNAALAFERVVDGRVLDFGTTGKLRNSDLVMYDRQTESWCSNSPVRRSRVP